MTRYGGDVSRVLDLVRGRIIFQEASDVQACLELICEKNPDLKVLRIRSSLHDWHNTSGTAEFRAVTVALRMDSRNARKLCAENHVCEIQLVIEPLEPFLASQDAHWRYLRFRDVHPDAHRHPRLPPSSVSAERKYDLSRGFDSSASVASLMLFSAGGKKPSFDGAPDTVRISDSASAPYLMLQVAPTMTSSVASCASKGVLNGGKNPDPADCCVLGPETAAGRGSNESVGGVKFSDKVDSNIAPCSSSRGRGDPDDRGLEGQDMNDLCDALWRENGSAAASLEGGGQGGEHERSGSSNAVLGGTCDPPTNFRPGLFAPRYWPLQGTPSSAVDGGGVGSKSCCGSEKQWQVLHARQIFRRSSFSKSTHLNPKSEGSHTPATLSTFDLILPVPNPSASPRMTGSASNSRTAISNLAQASASADTGYASGGESGNAGSLNFQWWIGSGSARQPQSPLVQPTPTHLLREAERWFETDLDVVEPVDLLALEVFQRSALNPGGKLRLLAAGVEKGFRTSSPGAMWFTSQPMAASSLHWTFRLAYVCLAAYFAQRTYQAHVAMGISAAFQASAVRFRVLETRGGASARVRTFGILSDGCHILPTRTSPPPPLNASSDPYLRNGSSISGPGELVAWVHLERPARINGFYFETDPHSTPDADPIRWIIDATSAPVDFSGDSLQLSGKAQWDVVGASEWQLTKTGFNFYYPWLSFPTPAEPRGAEVTLDHRQSWPQVLNFCMGTGEWAACLFTCAVVGGFGKEWLTRWIWLCCILINILAAGTNALAFYLFNQPRWVYQMLLTLWPSTSLFIGILFFERKIVQLFLAYVGFYYGQTLMISAYIYQLDIKAVLELMANAATAVLALVALIVYFRTRALRRARQLINFDCRRYDAAWTDMLVAAATDLRHSKRLSLLHTWVDELTAAVTRVSCNCPSMAPRQLFPDLDHMQVQDLAVEVERQEPTEKDQIVGRQASLYGAFRAGMIDDLGMTGCTARGGGGTAQAQPNLLRRWGSLIGIEWAGRPITSLDQLFVQALCVHPLLLQKVKAWAAVSNGTFPVHSNDMNRAESALLSNHLTLAEAAAEYPPIGLLFGSLKTSTRAVEKAVRSYNEDPSHLVDLCRQSIVFRSGWDLAVCLDAMADDSDAALVRIKNRMDPTEPRRGACCGLRGAVAEGGYRSVLVNLRLTTPDALALGVSGHVCEVQLLLQRFAEIKTDDGHRRYVTYRNLRAE